MDIWEIGRHQAATLLASLRDPEYHPLPPACICFDYFDTLVVRRVIPEHTKILASTQLCRLIQAENKGMALYAARRDLEQQLCAERIAAGKDADFHLADFAVYFFARIPAWAQPFLTGWTPEHFVETMLAIELAVEKQVQQPCPETVAVLPLLREQGYRLLLVSDFYLPSALFREMVQHHGLGEYFTDLFISADYDMTKGSGRLYGKISELLNCAPEQLVMIGDNPHADIHMARQAGYRAIQVVNPRQQEYYRSLQKRDAPSTGAASVEFPAVRKPLPFAEMGYSLWLFTHRLFEQLTREGINDVFFLSKEGEFLKRLFELYQQELFGQQRIRSHYLLVSRKATFLASLRPLEQEDFTRLFNHYRNISLREFLQSLNMEAVVVQRICATLAFDCSIRVDDVRNSEPFARLLASPIFREEYSRLRQQQRKNCIAYLNSFGVAYERDGLTLVDVGWKGSIQDNIYHILGGRVACRGFFLGSLLATECMPDNRKKGLLFDDYPGRSQYFDVYNNNRSLFEMLLGATHGSADGYLTAAEVLDNPPVPERVVHCRVQDGADAICVLTLDLPEERLLFRQTIAPLQEAMLELFSACNQSYMLAHCTAPDAKWFARQHARMVFTPEQGEVDLFMALYHLENFGIFEYTRFGVERRPGLRERLHHLRNVVKDRAVLESGIWPPVILHRLGIGPYRYIDGRIRMRKAFP